MRSRTFGGMELAAQVQPAAAGAGFLFWRRRLVGFRRRGQQRDRLGGGRGRPCRGFETGGGGNAVASIPAGLADAGSGAAAALGSAIGGDAAGAAGGGVARLADADGIAAEAGGPTILSAAAGALASGAGAAARGSALGGMIAIAIGAPSAGFGEKGWVSAVAEWPVSDGEKWAMTILAAMPTATA